MTTVKRFPFLYAICAIGIMALYYLPQLQIFFNIVSLAIIDFLFFLIFILVEGDTKKLHKLIVWSIPFILLMFLVAKPLDLKYGLVQNLMFMWVFVFPAILCKDILSRRNKRLNYTLVIACVLIFCYVVLQTMKQFDIMPEIARAMTSGNTDESFVESMKLLGVGGFGIAYSSGIFSIAFFSLFLRYNQSKTFGAVFLVLAIFSLYFAFTAKFTTLIIITLLSLAIMLFYHTQSTLKRIALIVAVLVVFFFLPKIVFYFAQINEGNSVGRNLADLYDSTWGGSNEVSLRETYRTMGFVAFIQSPIWGNNVTTDLKFLYTHSHSTIVEYAIATGFIGLFSFFGTMYQSFKINLVQTDKRTFKAMYYPIMAYYLLLSFYNPSNIQEICFTLFLLVPLLFNSFLQNNHSNIIDSSI